MMTPAIALAVAFLGVFTVGAAFGHLLCRRARGEIGSRR